MCDSLQLLSVVSLCIDILWAAETIGSHRVEPLSACVQVHTLEVFQKELNESEHLVFQAVHSLQRALQGDYRDVVNMKESSRQRLEALREAAIKVCLHVVSGHCGVILIR